MGGEDSEVGPETSELLLEAANFDPLDRAPDAHGGSGCARSRPPAGRKASTRTRRRRRRTLRDAAVRRARRGARGPATTDVEDGLPARPVVRLRPELVERLVGHRGLARGAARAAPVARVRGRRGGGDRADVARAGRHPAGRPRRGGRALPPRRGAADAPEPGGDRRAADEGAAAAPAGRGRLRRRGVPRGVHVDARPARRGADRAARSRSRPRWRRCARTSSSVSSSRRSATATPGSSGSRCSRWRGSSSLPTGSCPTSRGTSAAITDDGFFGAKGAAETLYRALHVEPGLRARHGP